jgi:hypothetical protein
MLAKVFSCAVIGLAGAIVEVEVDTANGLPTFVDVGSKSQRRSPAYGKGQQDHWQKRKRLISRWSRSYPHPGQPVAMCQKRDWRRTPKLRGLPAR